MRMPLGIIYPLLASTPYFLPAAKMRSRTRRDDAMRRRITACDRRTEAAAVAVRARLHRSRFCSGTGPLAECVCMCAPQNDTHTHTHMADARVGLHRAVHIDAAADDDDDDGFEHNLRLTVSVSGTTGCWS